MQIKITPTTAPYIMAACDDAEDSPESVDCYDMTRDGFAELSARVWAVSKGGTLNVSTAEAEFIADRMRDEAKIQRCNCEDLYPAERRKLQRVCRALEAVARHATHGKECESGEKY